MNIISSDNSIIINPISLCDFDIKTNPANITFSLFKQNSSSISLSGLGSTSSKLTANLKLSNNPSNILSIDSTGLLALAGDVENTDETVKITNGDTVAGYLNGKLVAGDNITLTVGSVGGNQHLTISSDTGITAINRESTPTLVLLGTGTADDPLYGNVRISATAGNSLHANSDGLYTPSLIETPLTVNDSLSVDFTASGTSNHTLTAFVKISANAGNVVTAVSDGLFVNPLVANDSSTIDFTQSGTYNNIVTASAKISSVGGNTLVDNAGLYVPASSGAQTPLTANDSSTIDFTTSGTDNHTLTGVVKISATGGNSLVDSTGLYVPTKTATNGLNETTPNLFKLGGGLTENTLINGSFDLAFNNRKVLIGNLYTDLYADSSPSANVAQFHVRASNPLNSLGNAASSFYYNLGLDGTGSFGSGRGYVVSSSLFKINTTSNTTVPISSVAASQYNGLQIQNTAAGNLSLNVNRPLSPTVSVILPLTGYASNTSTISNVAGFATLPIFQESGGHDFTEITTYSGLFLAASDETIIEGSKLVNKFGVNQVGVNDVNVFRGNINYYGSLTNASDVRIKDNIEDYSKGLDVINQIRVVDFDYVGIYKRENDDKHIGVIAQELEEILPEAVKTIKNDTFDDFKTIDQSVLIFTLINAVKELSKEVELLKANK